jgi:hypothetical protein
MPTQNPPPATGPDPQAPQGQNPTALAPQQLIPHKVFPVNPAEQVPRETVSLDSRYQMAWIEVTTRITQRQNALYLFFAISGAITGYFSYKGSASTTDIWTIAFWVQLIGLLGVPVVAVAFARLNAKHDETIALLRKFLAECEASGLAPNSPTLTSLSYNGNHRTYAVPAKKYRKYHDTAFSWAIRLLCAVGLILVLGSFLALQERANPGNWALFGVYVMIYGALTFFCGPFSAHRS